MESLLSILGGSWKFLLVTIRIYMLPKMDSKSIGILSLLALNSITLEQVYLLELPISIEEISEAINSLKVNKSLGSDGLTAEFYRKFKLILLPHLQRLFKDCLREKRTPPSWGQAKLVLLPKLDRDQMLLQSYRPASLLNANYKLLNYLQQY